MKRLITLLLAAVILFSLAVTAYAVPSGSVTVSTTVYGNSPTWTLRIPDNIHIPFRSTNTEIGTVEIINMNNPQNTPGYVDLTLYYGNLRKDNDYYYELPLDIYGNAQNYNGNYVGNSWISGQTFDYCDSEYGYYDPNGNTPTHSAVFGDYLGNHYGSGGRAYPVDIWALITEEDWNYAVNNYPGEYSTTLTFDAEFKYPS